MKKFKIFLISLLILPCIFMFSACNFLSASSTTYITNIEQTSSVGNQDYYTITYSDGSKSNIVIKNGTDGLQGEKGKDGTSISLNEIKTYCEENGLDFEEFLATYLRVGTQEETIKLATSKALNSVVSVWSEYPTYEYNLSKNIQVGCGAGVIFLMETDYSYIVTNYHVVYNIDSLTSNKIAQSIHIYQYGADESVYKTGSYDSKGYPIIGYSEGAISCTYIGGSLTYDIAVLKVSTSSLQANNPNACAVDIATEYSIADNCLAIGNPQGEGISVTQGIVSVESEYISMKAADEATTVKFRVMRIDSAINGGNSGGGLFNSKGELIGIVNAKVVDSTIDNMAYALPIDNVKNVAENLIYYYKQNNSNSKVKNLNWGISLEGQNHKSVYNSTTGLVSTKEDVTVSSIASNNAIATSIGFKIGDIITNLRISSNVSGNNVVKDYEISHCYQVNDLLLSLRPTDTIMFTITRNGNTTTVGYNKQAGLPTSYFTVVD